MADFWGDVGNAWGNKLYETFTGKAAPGTDARKLSDLQGNVQRTLLQSTLDEARRKTPELTQQQQLDLALQAGQKWYELANKQELDKIKLAGGTSRLDVLGQKTEIADRSYDNRLSSETASRKDLLAAEGDQRLRLLGGTPVELEKYLADSDGALADRYMQYAGQAQERAIKAQQQGRVLPFIGGLLATAASLFA